MKTSIQKFRRLGSANLQLKQLQSSRLSGRNGTSVSLPGRVAVEEFGVLHRAYISGLKPQTEVQHRSSRLALRACKDNCSHPV